MICWNAMPPRASARKWAKAMSSSFRHLVFLGASAVAISANAAGGDTSQARADLQLSDEEGGAQASLRNQTYDTYTIRPAALWSQRHGSWLSRQSVEGDDVPLSRQA